MASHLTRCFPASGRHDRRAAISHRCAWRKGRFLLRPTPLRIEPPMLAGSRRAGSEQVPDESRRCLRSAHHCFRPHVGRPAPIRTCREPDIYQLVGRLPDVQDCRPPCQDMGCGSKHIAGRRHHRDGSPIRVGLPGRKRSSRALGNSPSNARLNRHQTLTSKRSSIMTLFQAITKALTKRL